MVANQEREMKFLSNLFDLCLDIVFMSRGFAFSRSSGRETAVSM